METIKRNIPDKIFLFFIFLAVLLLPVHVSLTSPPLILSFFILLLPFAYKIKWQNLRSGRNYIIFAALYFLFVVGYFLSADKNAAANDLKIKLYILLIPVFWAAFGAFTKKEKTIIVRFFVFSCIAFALFCMSRALFYFITEGENYFYYKELVSFTVIHPSYIGMFQAFASIIIVLELMENSSKYSAKIKTVLVLAVFLLMLSIFLLTAKMAILSMFLFLNIALFIWGKRTIGIKRSIIFILGGNIFAVLMILALPYTRERMKLLFTYNEVAYDNSVNSRSEIWEASVQLIKKNPVIGIGSGNSEKELVEQYRKNGFIKGVESRYNAHNQYLQVLIETGIIGLSIFLGFLIYCLNYAIRQKNYLYICFLLLFMINILTETMLGSQSGVVFFVFFNSLLGLSFSRD